MAENNGKNKNNGKKRLFVRLKRRLRLSYLKILRIDDPPERIARGAAIGVFMGVVPTFGVGGLLALAFAFLLKANKAAAVVASMIMNPLTSPFFWTLSALVGSFALREDYSSIVSKINGGEFIHGLGRATVVYLAGNIIIAGVFTFGTYFLVKNVVIRHRARKAAKRLKTAP